VTPEAALERAAALLDLRRPQEAIEHLRRAQATAPDVPELHAMTGFAYLQLGDFAQALTAGQAAVTHGPEQEWGHRICSVALVRLGHPLLAKQAALEAARLAPEAAAAHIVLASALQATGDNRGAVAAARRAIELDPHDTDAHSTLGEIMFEQDRPNAAIPAYERALALDPEDADALNNLAVARLRAHQRAGTGEQFETAARLDPRLDVARHNLLHTGPAGRSFVYRRVSTGALAYAVITTFSEPTSVPFFLTVLVVFEAIRALEVRRLSAPTRQLLADDRRARRLKPRRWDWQWPLRLHSLWWLLFDGLSRDARRARRRRRDPV
jgi:tetratricopeptide (TPR) repeat protein